MKLHDDFANQALACANLGSPFTARICALASKHLTRNGAVGQTLLDWPGDTGARAQAVPLRFMGALHALSRLGRCEVLSAIYPPHHEDLSDAAVWAAVEAAMATEAAFLLNWMTSPPQTNEVQRCNALVPGFLTAAAHFGLPLVTSELGASMGLNLRWNRFHYRFGEGDWGDPASPVHLSPNWTGPPPPVPATSLVESAGCDLNPLDPAAPKDVARMMSYIWPDQAARLARTGAAIALAASDGKKVARADAFDWLEWRLATPRPGVTHVICHSIAWQYFPNETQVRIHALLEEHGASATPKAPLAWLRMEGNDGGPGAGITLTLWPEGQTQEVGRVDFHGRWVNWRGWQG